jgi:hypothetical protein
MTGGAGGATESSINIIVAVLFVAEGNGIATELALSG